MPINHTPNYDLSQWEPSDKVLRTDFNADNAKIDAALAGKASAAAVDSLARRATAASTPPPTPARAAPVRAALFS